MTEREGLLAAVYAAPDDDLPRLVFADWLDENGEPERAEFIRFQIERAKYAPDDPAASHETSALLDPIDHGAFELVSYRPMFTWG